MRCAHRKADSGAAGVILGVGRPRRSGQRGAHPTERRNRQLRGGDPAGALTRGSPGESLGYHDPFGPPEGSALINRGWVRCRDVSKPKVYVTVAL